MSNSLLLLIALGSTALLGGFAWLVADTASEAFVLTAVFCVCVAVPCVTISYGNAWQHRPGLKPVQMRRFATMMVGIAVALLFSRAFV